MLFLRSLLIDASLMATWTACFVIESTVSSILLLWFVILTSIGIDCLYDLRLVDIHRFLGLFFSRGPGELLLERLSFGGVWITRVDFGLSHG